MRLKYDSYMLDETVPKHLASTLVSLVVHSMEVNKLLLETRTLVRSVNLTKSYILVEFVDGTENAIVLGDSAPYWAATDVVPDFGSPQLEPKEILIQLLLEVIEILYMED